MKWAILIVRTLVGLVFVVFGVDYFAHFLTPPTPEGETIAAFFKAMATTGYMSFVKVLEITGGALLLTGLLVPLGIVLLTPVIVNILCFDLFLAHAPGLGGPLLAMMLFLIYGYWGYFKAIFTINAKPRGT